MKRQNGDLPANPIELRSIGEFAHEVHTGLTKRELFAAMAMQGLLSKHGDDDYSCDQIASYAAAHANALLKELERDK